MGLAAQKNVECPGSHVAHCHHFEVPPKNQTHKRLKGTLYDNTKHARFGVSTFFKQYNMLNLALNTTENGHVHF